MDAGSCSHGICLHFFLGQDLEVDRDLCSKAESPGAGWEEEEGPRNKTQRLQQGTSHPEWRDWKGQPGAEASEDVGGREMKAEVKSFV